MEKLVDRATSRDDGFDWPLLMYAATVLLHKTEAQFWRMTPSKLHELMKVHVEVNGGNKKDDKQGFIDQIF